MYRKRRVFAVVVDYDLWWKLESGTAAPASDGAASTLPFGSMIGKTLLNLTLLTTDEAGITPQ